VDRLEVPPHGHRAGLLHGRPKTVGEGSRNRLDMLHCQRLVLRGLLLGDDPDNLGGKFLTGRDAGHPKLRHLFGRQEHPHVLGVHGLGSAISNLGAKR
jgi:hypothetical protein